MRLVFFFFFIISALVAQDVREEADYSFNISKTSVLKIYGEIDVIIENWQKNEVSIHTLLDIRQRGLVEASSGKNEILVRQNGETIEVTRKKPNIRLSIVSFIEDRSKITLILPKWLSVDIDVEDAEIIADELTGSAKLRCDDGSIVINSLESDRGRIELGDGSFAADFLGGNITLSYDDGSAQIGAVQTEKFIVQFDDGSLQMKLGDEAKSVFIEYDDGSAVVSLLEPELFSILLELDDGSFSNATGLTRQQRNENTYFIGNKNAQNTIQVWFNDGALTLK
jgi:hypothetical protein